MMKRVLAVAAIGVVLVATLFLAWRALTGPDPMALKPPAATVRFGDGALLEVLGLAESEWVDGIVSKPSRGWSALAWRSSTTSFGHERDLLKIKIFTLDDKLAGLRYLPGAGRLAMSVRLVDPAGGPVSPEGMKPEELKLRLSDGAGDWIDGSGPFGAEDDPALRGVVSFAGWPRGGKELVFQAQRAGQATVEFRMPNPVAGVAPVVRTVTPLPQTRSGDFWKMNFSTAWEARVPGKGKCLVPEIEFHSDLPENGSFSPVLGWVDAVAGARGTRSERSIYVDHSGELKFGYAMPPDEDQFTFHYRVRYNESYPHPRSGVGFIFTGGVVSKDGKSIDSGTVSRKLGLDSVDLGLVEAAAESWRPGSYQFTLSVKGNWKDAAEKSAAEAVWGAWKDWMPVVFINGGDRSSGSVQLSGSNLSSGLGASGFQWSGLWQGDLKPGDQVEIGVMPHRPDEVFEFVLDRTALSGP